MMSESIERGNGDKPLVLRTTFVGLADSILRNQNLVENCLAFPLSPSFARAPAHSVNEIIVSLLALAMPDAFSSSFWAFVVQYFCIVVH
jgi:hypothetical protein